MHTAGHTVAQEEARLTTPCTCVALVYTCYEIGNYTCVTLVYTVTWGEELASKACLGSGQDTFCPPATERGVADHVIVCSNRCAMQHRAETAQQLRKCALFIGCSLRTVEVMVDGTDACTG
jgi:hypothetical protein